MRRFASVFVPRRDKEKDRLPGPPPSASTVSLASPFSPSAFSSPPFSGPGSDSASSSGSASLQTPDDLVMLERAPSKSWINTWLSKKPSTKTKPKPKHAWVPSPPPRLQPPPVRAAAPVVDSDSDSEVSEGSSVSVSGATRGAQRRASATARSAVPYLAARLQNDLVSRPSPSPFLSTASAYPRSATRPRQSRHPDASLHTAMLKTHLLHRLAHPLTPAEQASIRPLAMKSAPSLLAPFAASVDEVAVPKRARVTSHVPGLRRWIDRPCFEHRFAVWMPSGDDVKPHIVTGTRFAVPDLDFSQALEAMVDFSEQHPPLFVQTVSPPPPEPARVESAPSDVPSRPASVSSQSSQSRSLVHASAPSPLRNHAETPQTLPMSPPPSPPETVKRGVRFAEDDKEDQIPIGYIMRVKKQREAKAVFLREEKERRLLADEQAKINEERKKMEEQRAQWEQERRAWEKEKRAVEEERNKRLYADEIAATRARRESSRAGIPKPSASSPGPSPRASPNGERNRDHSTRYSRPDYDPIQPSPRRQASEPAASHSRPSSLAGHSSIAHHSPQNGSRPSSLYSSSSDDVRTKRQSNASTSNGRWSSSNTSLLPPSPSFIPPPSAYGNSFFPPQPAFDMPLLPPTAPFMLHQYSRSRSQQSLSPSPSRSSGNRSTDHVNRTSTHESTSNRSTSSSPHRPVGHQRRPSADNNPLRTAQRGRASEPASASAPRHQTSSLSSRTSTNYLPRTYSSGTLPTRRATAIS